MSSTSILRDISQLYSGNNNSGNSSSSSSSSNNSSSSNSSISNSDMNVGLSEMGLLVGEKVHGPRRKVTVMFIGNHSAGKSSFINWYIGHNIMPTVT